MAITQAHIVENINQTFPTAETIATRRPVYRLLKLGTIGIQEADRLMSELTKLRAADQIPDILLIGSHHPVLSLGARKLTPKDLLKPLEFFQKKDISLFQSNRGGGLTFHWQGQLVVYPILKLRTAEQQLSQFMFKLEEVGLRTLQGLGIQAERKREKTAQIGLWYKHKKIASMGIYVSNWVTSYGFALNLGGDFEPANFIRPCGLDAKLTTVQNEVGMIPDQEKVIKSVMRNFEDVFNREEIQTSPYDKNDLNQIERAHLN